ncbi:MAG: uncharacterized protein KVP18_002827 [Porospora cf. gigantea A]|uniref:uncharacterized protein n=1 Tax=Porospora cf. gigantea A TaxID=2853593 RepID=UPI003559AC8C|nr:MAG: hypothetical protein KVP18_002827 [Porospora cf. gigantea A]
MQQLVTELEAALKDLEELRTCSVQASLEVASLKTQNAEVKEELRGTRERYDETRGQLLTRALEGKSEAEQQSALKLQETVRILRQEMESQFLSQMEAARRHHSEELAVERQKTQSLSEELRARGDGTQLDLLRSELDELQRNYDDLRDLAQRVKDESQDYEVQVLSLQQALTRADSMCSSQAEQMQDVDCRLRQLDNERVQAEVRTSPE